MGDYVKKQTLFDHIPWEYLGQPINFSADLPNLRIEICDECKGYWH